jgi:hypothetical protein
MTYAIWKPEHDGHAPPNWREGMKGNGDEPYWWVGRAYLVPAEAVGESSEALNSPNDDAKPYEWQVDAALHVIRRLPAEELAKHGITLAPEKDWATELWADIWEARGEPSYAGLVRDGHVTATDRSAIDLIRTRFEQMKGEQ